MSSVRAFELLCSKHFGNPVIPMFLKNRKGGPWSKTLFTNDGSKALKRIGQDKIL